MPPKYTPASIRAELGQGAAPRRRTRSKLGYKGKKTTKNFRRKVKAIVFGLAEKKLQTWNDEFNFASYDSTVLSTFIVPISPYAGYVAISQNTGEAGRIGNEIRTASARITGIMYPLPYNATINPTPEPLEVRMWFFSVKGQTQLPTTLGNFFENGATANTPDGTVRDLVKHVNQDLYTYRGHRTWKLGTANFTGTGAQPLYQNFQNNDFKYNCKFSIDITKMMSKHYKFPDTTNTPQSSSFFFIEAVRANGGEIDPAYLVAHLTYQIEYQYTDV